MKKQFNLNTQEQREIVSFVTQKFDDFKQARAEKEGKWGECIKAFLNKHNYNLQDANKWRSKIYVPLSYEAATNIYSNLKRTLFPTDSAFFTVESRNPGVQDRANVVQSWLLSRLDQMNFIDRFGKFLKQLVIIGNSAAVIYWDDNKPGGTIFDTINMFDIVFDPAVTNWADGLIIHRSTRPLNALLNNPVYSNTKGLKVQAILQDDSNIIEAARAFDIQQDLSKKEDAVKLFSAYGDFKIGDKVYTNHIAVVANDIYLIRFEPNPYPEKPFLFCTYESVPNEIYGIGALEPGLGVQYLVNTFTNQKSDVMSLIINGMWSYVDDGILDPEEIIAQPGALIPVKDTRNIQPLHPDTNVALAFTEIAQLKAEYQEITGANKYFTGGPTIDFNKTATEVSAIQQAGLTRFSEVAQNVEENALKRAIKLIYEYNNIFNDSHVPILVEHEGKQEYLTYSPQMFMDMYNFRIVGSNSSISRDIRINKLLEFIKLAGSMPVIAQSVNLVELVKKLYRELGFKDDSQMFIHQVMTDGNILQGSNPLNLQ